MNKFLRIGIISLVVLLLSVSVVSASGNNGQGQGRGVGGANTTVTPTTTSTPTPKLKGYEKEKNKDKEKDDNGCPAAPAVANKYLKSVDFKKTHKQYNKSNKNIISLVAQKMGPETDFDGAKKCDSAYKTKVEDYVKKLIITPVSKEIKDKK